MTFKIIFCFVIFDFQDDFQETKLLRPFLSEANEKLTWYTKVLAIYLPCIFVVILIVMGTLNVTYSYLVYGFIDGDRLYFPYQFM